MWKFVLLLLLTASLNAFASAVDHPRGFSVLFDALNSCQLTVKGTMENPEMPSTVVSYGILNRFASSDPPANPLTISSGGTADLWNKVDDRTYTVGFSVRSDQYSSDHLAYIVTQQWPGTNLFESDVAGNGNWEVVSVTC